VPYYCPPWSSDFCSVRDPSSDWCLPAINGEGDDPSACDVKRLLIEVTTKHRPVHHSLCYG
jgi:hypothetical protein